MAEMRFQLRQSGARILLLHYPLGSRWSKEPGTWPGKIQCTIISPAITESVFTTSWFFVRCALPKHPTAMLSSWLLGRLEGELFSHSLKFWC